MRPNLASPGDNAVKTNQRRHGGSSQTVPGGQHALEIYLGIYVEMLVRGVGGEWGMGGAGGGEEHKIWPEAKA